ncbi:MAG: hypothetical protein HYS55_00740 [Candidatus Omnitrophica bacterium]|nr:hypothetical protein [Candidatus Omnitrophota bacterium]
MFVLLNFSISAFADRQETQVQIESKLVEVNNTQLRELGVDFNREPDAFKDRRINNLETDQLRSLERARQIANPDPMGNAFDFNPLQPSPNQLPETQMNLAVKPVVQKDGNIGMEVEPKSAETTTEIQEGQTPVLGGLKQVGNSEKKSDQVPLLGKIPILGRLFGGKEKQPDKKELLVFVTPTIINPSE